MSWGGFDVWVVVLNWSNWVSTLTKSVDHSLLSFTSLNYGHKLGGQGRFTDICLEGYPFWIGYLLTNGKRLRPYGAN